jgi:hypothetical protein
MRLFAALALALALALPAGAGTWMGEAAEVRGPARLITGGAVQDLTAGAPLHEGDQVLTGPNALALLLLTPDIRIHLGPDSALTLTQDLALAGGQLMLGGAMVFDRPPGGAPLTLATAFGEIGVRGTRFFVGPSRDVYAVFVDRGEVQVTAEGVTVTLTAGQGTELIEGQPPAPPVSWGAARIAEAFGSVGLAR